MTHINHVGEVYTEEDGSTKVETQMSQFVQTGSDKYFVNKDNKYKY